jgi:hypothetical protein
VDTFSVISSKLPSVEGALQTVALDDAPGCQISSHVRTIGVDGMRAAILAAKYCYILACKCIITSIRKIKSSITPLMSCGKFAITL